MLVILSTPLVFYFILGKMFKRHMKICMTERMLPCNLMILCLVRMCSYLVAFGYVRYSTNGMEFMTMGYWVTHVYVGTFIIILSSLMGTTFMSNDAMGCLSFLILLSSIKVGISIMQYLPQAILNYKRESTCGWNIWNNFLGMSSFVYIQSHLIILIKMSWMEYYHYFN